MSEQRGCLGCSFCSHQVVALLHKTKLWAEPLCCYSTHLKRMRGWQVGTHIHTHTHTQIHIFRHTHDCTQTYTQIDICTHTNSSSHTQVMVRRKSTKIFFDSSLPPGSLLTALIWVLWWQRYSQGLICTSKSPNHTCMCMRVGGCVSASKHKTGNLTVWLNVCVNDVKC